MQARRFFRDLSGTLVIPGVKPIDVVRRENLELLILEYGTQEALAAAADTTPVYLSQIRRQAVDTKTGRPRQLGTQMARRLESAQPYPKPAGWMDVPRTPEEIEAIKKLIAAARAKAAEVRQAPALQSLGLTAEEPPGLYSVERSPLKLRDFPAFLLAMEFDALPERLAGGVTKAQLLREMRETIARHAAAVAASTRQ